MVIDQEVDPIVLGRHYRERYVVELAVVELRAGTGQ